jgi:radical SAM superfamily enzyme YgiQ (UPF0313 family)
MLKPTDRPLATPAALGEAEQAVLRALAYRQVFASPLTLDELWQSLDTPGVSPAEVTRAVDRLVSLGRVVARDGACWIAGMPDPVAAWQASRNRADAALPQAMAVGRGLMRLPFVDGVALSGSLSKRAMAEDGDFDFFVITRPGRLWIVHLLLRFYRQRLPSPEMLCANYLLASHRLALERRDLFTAIELTTLVPVGGQAALQQLREANGWVSAFQPNQSPATVACEPEHGAGRRAAEWLLGGVAGSLLDMLAWRLVRRRHQRRLADLPGLSARRSVQIERHVAKLHTMEWKYRILSAYHDHLDRLAARAGQPLLRGTRPGRVLVASAYFYRLDPKQWQAAKPYPPLGTLYAAGLVRSLGFATEVFDAGLAESEFDFLARLEQARPEFVVLQEDGFNYLTKMCLGRMREAALQMVKLARAFGAQVLVSSSDATDEPEPYLRAGARAVVRGESEATLAEVLQAWRAGRPWTDIAGLAWLEGGALARSPVRAPITDLDRLPAPAWDLVSLASYQAIWRRRHGRFSLNIATTRGCPYACNWCAKPLYGKRYTVRSPEQVVDELAMLVQQQGAEHFWITDDLFGLKPGWVQRFAELVRARGLTLSYTIQTRADLVMRDAADVEAMARSGLEMAWIGAESGSQRILDAMDKGITRSEIDDAVQRLRDHRVGAALFLQFGYLGETAEDIRMTHDMVDALKPDDIGISVAYPLPGTVFHERVKATMGAKTHWLHSHDLALMFPGSFTPAFYRHLHTYTARRFHVQRCWQSLGGQRPWAPRANGLRLLASMLRALPPLLWARWGLWREQRREGGRPVVPAVVP